MLCHCVFQAAHGRLLLDALEGKEEEEKINQIAALQGSLRLVAGPIEAIRVSQVIRRHKPNNYIV